MQVFISYSRSHKFIAETIQEFLIEEGFETWLDLNDIQGGELWEQKILKAVQNSAVMLVLVTTPTLSSKPIAIEIAIAKQSSIEIIPLVMERLDNVAQALEMLLLADRQAIDFVNQPKTNAQKQLLLSLNRISTGWSILHPYLPKLKNSNPAIRRQAVKLLGMSRSNFAIPHLLTVLMDEDADVLTEAILALSDIPDLRSSPALVNLINRYLEREYKKPEIELDNIRYNSITLSIIENALLALGNIGDKNSVSFLISILEMDYRHFGDWTISLRIAAGAALGKLRDNSAVEPLIKCLEEEDDNLKFAAVISLALIGDKRAVKPLIHFLENERLSIITWQDEGYDFDEEYIHDEMGRGLWMDLCIHYHITDPVVENLCYEAMTLSCAVCVVLGLFADKNAVDPLLQYIQVGLPQNLYGVQGAALALGFLGDVNTRELLLNILNEGDGKFYAQERQTFEAALRIFDDHTAQ